MMYIKINKSLDIKHAEINNQTTYEHVIMQLQA